MTAGLLDLQGGGASFVEVQAAVAGHAAGGRQVGRALGMAEGVALWGETGRYARLPQVTRVPCDVSVWEELAVAPPTQAGGGLPAEMDCV